MIKLSGDHVRYREDNEPARDDPARSSADAVAVAVAIAASLLMRC